MGGHDCNFDRGMRIRIVILCAFNSSLFRGVHISIFPLFFHQMEQPTSHDEKRDHFLPVNKWRENDAGHQQIRGRYGHTSEVLPNEGLIIIGGTDSEGRFLSEVAVWSLEGPSFRSPHAMPAVFGEFL